MKNCIKVAILTIFLLFTIILFSASSIYRNKSEIWFANPDQDGTMVIDTLRVNSGKRPHCLDHPSHGTFIIYGNIFKLLHSVNLLPTCSFSQLEQSKDPLMLLPELFYKGRLISIFICILCGLIFGSIFFVLTGRYIFFVLGTSILLLSGGVFAQSLLIRSEHTSVLFVLLAALIVAIQHKYSMSIALDRCSRLICGVALGFAVLSKVHVTPAVLFVTLISFCVYLNRKNEKQSNISRKEKIFGLAINIFIIFEAFIAIRYEYPILYFIFLLLIIAAQITVSRYSLKKFKFLFAFSKLGLLFLGFLIAFHISFHCLNFNSDTDGLNRHWKKMTYVKAFKPFETIEVFSSSMKTGSPSVYRDFIRFCKHYSVTSFHFILITALIILNLVVPKKPPTLLAVITILFGLLFCIVSSLRYFKFIYLIYTDIFFVGAILLLLYQLSTNEVMYSLKIVLLISPLVCLYIFTMAFKQYSFVSEKYDGMYLKDRADKIYCFVMCPDEYEELMLSKYGSVEAIIKRVCNDPYLNGSDRGIELHKKASANKYYLQHFADIEKTHN